jgi:hypothetical protein
VAEREEGAPTSRSLVGQHCAMGSREHTRHEVGRDINLLSRPMVVAMRMAAQDAPSPREGLWNAGIGPRGERTVGGGRSRKKSRVGPSTLSLPAGRGCRGGRRGQSQCRLSGRRTQDPECEVNGRVFDRKDRRHCKGERKIPREVRHATAATLERAGTCPACPRVDPRGCRAGHPESQDERCQFPETSRQPRGRPPRGRLSQGRRSTGGQTLRRVDGKADTLSKAAGRSESSTIAAGPSRQSSSA